MDCNLKQKKLLLAFWDKFMKLRTHEKRIRLLQDYAEIVIPYRKQQGLDVRRDQFNETKYKLHNLHSAVNDECWVCRYKADIRHHIIQLKHGGLNSKKNLISLCKSCHAEVHPHLMPQLIEECDSLYDLIQTLPKP